MSAPRSRSGAWPGLPARAVLGLWLLVAGLSFAVVDQPLAAAVLAAPETVRRLARLVSSATDPVLVLPVLVAVLVAAAGVRLKRGAVADPDLGVASILTLCGLSATLASLALKGLVGHGRPSLAAPFDAFAFRPLAFDDSFGSMPSAQAALAGALVLCVSILAPRLAWPARLVGLGVCASRVLVGEHWLSDTLLGWALGLVVTLAACRLVCTRRVTHRRP